MIYDVADVPGAMGLLVLLAAALLEAGGDALVRAGLRSQSTPRVLLFVAGATMLFFYGYLVNTAGWDFGRLLGIYVVMFFIVAQVISWAAFNQPPATSTFVGGAVVVAGGLITTLWSR